MVKTLSKTRVVTLIAITALGYGWYEHIRLSNTQNSRSADDDQASRAREAAPSANVTSIDPGTKPASPSTSGSGGGISDGNNDRAASPTIADAQTLIDRGDVHEGVRLLEEIARKDPANTQALMELAMAYTLDLKDPGKARGVLERILDINPDHRAALNELEVVYKELGVIEDGLALLQLKAQQFPESLELQFVYGRLLAQSDPASALPWLEKATAIPDQRIEALDQLAAAALRAGKPQLAIKSWTQALTIAEEALEQARLRGDPGTDFMEDQIAITKAELAKARDEQGTRQPQ